MESFAWLCHNRAGSIKLIIEVMKTKIKTKPFSHLISCNLIAVNYSIDIFPKLIVTAFSVSVCFGAKKLINTKWN